MPRIEVRLFRASNGRTPVWDWMESLPRKAQDKVLAKIERLRLLGHELRRPDADLLRDGIWELRIRFQSQYRLLYFFFGQGVAVLSHGFTKDTGRVPPEQIDRAIHHRDAYKADPDRHTETVEL